MQPERRRELIGAAIAAEAERRGQAGPVPGFPDAEAPAGPSGSMSSSDIARLYETILGPERRDTGTFYTPASLIDWILDRALEPFLEGADPTTIRVLDPACGTGLFLIAAASRIADRLRAAGRDPALAVGCVAGSDIDPLAIDIARACLWLDHGVDPGERLQVTDGLALADERAFDLVVGNPPFLNQLERRSALGEEAAAAVRRRWSVGAYTDVSALFLRAAADLVKHGGVVALVQPQSVLAARDAGPVRRHWQHHGAITHAWSANDPIFPGTPVRTCALVLHEGAEPGPVDVWFGADFDHVGPAAPPTTTWSSLFARAQGIPSVTLDHDRTIGDIAVCAADFRDQYYGLRRHVRETDASATAPLVTSGLIDPLRLLWGERPTRFDKKRWSRPAVDPADLAGDPAMADWARSRLVPKVLLATQGRTLEAVVDPTGTLLPSVPVISVIAEPDRLWHLAAALSAPPVLAHAASTYAGTALQPGAVKLSARQVAALPLPVDNSAWDEGAHLARAAQTSGDDRDRLLVELADTMCRAYGVPADGLLAWWRERAGVRI